MVPHNPLNKSLCLPDLRPRYALSLVNAATHPLMSSLLIMIGCLANNWLCSCNNLAPDSAVIAGMCQCCHGSDGTLGASSCVITSCVSIPLTLLTNCKPHLEIEYDKSVGQQGSWFRSRPATPQTPLWDTSASRCSSQCDVLLLVLGTGFKPLCFLLSWFCTKMIEW